MTQGRQSVKEKDVFEVPQAKSDTFFPLPLCDDGEGNLVVYHQVIDSATRHHRFVIAVVGVYYFSGCFIVEVAIFCCRCCW